MNDEYQPLPGEVVAGALDIGISEDGREVVINAADVAVDEKGRCFFKFSPRQARHLSRVMEAKADAIDPLAKVLEPTHPKIMQTINLIRQYYGQSRAAGHTYSMINGITRAHSAIVMVADDNHRSTVARMIADAAMKYGPARSMVIVTLAEIGRLIGMHGALAIDHFVIELILGQAENEIARLRREMRKAIADWHRFQDFINGDSPGEMFRLTEAKKKHPKDVMGGFLSYLASLWNDLAELRHQLNWHKERQQQPLAIEWEGIVQLMRGEDLIIDERLIKPGGTVLELIKSAISFRDLSNEMLMPGDQCRANGDDVWTDIPDSWVGSRPVEHTDCHFRRTQQHWSYRPSGEGAVSDQGPWFDIIFNLGVVATVCGEGNARAIVGRLNDYKMVVAYYRILAAQHGRARLDEVAAITKELDAMRELRDGDSELIRNLAQAIEIHISAPDNLPGRQWEQFHAGVMKLKERIDNQRQTIITYQEAAPAGVMAKLEAQNQQQSRIIAHFSGLALAFRATLQEIMSETERDKPTISLGKIAETLASGQIDPAINAAQFEEWFLKQTNRPATDSLDDLSRAIARMAWNAARGVQDSPSNG